MQPWTFVAVGDPETKRRIRVAAEAEEKESYERRMPQEWLDAYAAGGFTEFMEQRAPGHTVADGKLYRKGMLDFKADIAKAEAALDFERDPEALDKREQLRAMSIACDAVILFAQRHAALARAKAVAEADPGRRAELERIAAVCDRVPAHAPRRLNP